jgi:hypothetical protein
MPARGVRSPVQGRGRPGSIRGARISGHCTRVGMAQDLTVAGQELNQIMRAGRWKSPAMVARYTERLDAGARRGRQLLPARGGGPGAGGMTTTARQAAEALAGRSAAGELFVIDHPIGGLRPAAHLFACDQGVGFADLGWQDPNTVGQHTMHVIEGTERAAGGGRFTINGPDGHTEFMPLNGKLRARLQLPAGPLDPGPGS